MDLQASTPFRTISVVLLGALLVGLVLVLRGVAGIGDALQLLEQHGEDQREEATPAGRNESHRKPRKGGAWRTSQPASRGCRKDSAPSPQCTSSPPRYPRLMELIENSTDVGSCGCNAAGQQRCLPSAIIAGIEKGGTGELKAWLSAHPKINMVMSEIRFFNRPNPSGSLGPYLRSGFCLSEEHRLSGSITMEKSPSYMMAYCDAAPRIARALPSAKLVVLLRDPASRAYSSFHHHCQRGRVFTNPHARISWNQATDDAESARASQTPCDARHFDVLVDTAKLQFAEGNKTVQDFYEKVDASAECMLADGYFKDNHGIFSHGVYSAGFEEFFKRFGRDRVHVVLSNEWVEHPHEELQRIEDFLGLPNHVYRSHKNMNGFHVVEGVGYKSKGNRKGYQSASTSSMTFLHDFYAHDVARMKSLLPGIGARMDKYWGWTAGISAASG
mmetsp:Transcript_38645/g.74090  ORF Transcript_38645/g.74090 Transcript_38645/m.74090 type:complete len:444 (+) Transcript_38645:361-1692(+)|eukprot:CAMPEP_0114234334 /NCGR_PEP_ID=MMETSP0058-20121206/5657_1 /TAXON_ID=36894 /ORGANISM="Pyramimonas parkeae, CCMP726" /LENGTH=443 /DNA_ID=CAMNT_0001346013 /DNA_START=428 /DNA_END=1759 /DNA_ORIENTATION=-